MTLIDKYYFNKYDIDYINGGLFHVAFYCLKKVKYLFYQMAISNKYVSKLI